MHNYNRPEHGQKYTLFRVKHLEQCFPTRVLQNITRGLLGIS